MKRFRGRQKSRGLNGAPFKILGFLIKVRTSGLARPNSSLKKPKHDPIHLDINFS